MPKLFFCNILPKFYKINTILMDPSVNVFDLHKKRLTGKKIHCGACDTLRRFGLNKLRIILIIVVIR